MGRLMFEWDQEKANSNFRKHSVSFEEASTALSYTQREETIRIISARLATRKERFMKSIRPDPDDSLRAEYKRSDFGELVRGKFGATQVEFAELVKLLLTCVGEDQGMRFESHSAGNYLASHQTGDWTYEIDNGNQVNLRHWISEFRSLEEPISNPPCVMTPKEREELLGLLDKHVRLLANRVSELNGRS